MELQKKIQRLVDSLPFMLLINIVIIINAILIGIETFYFSPLIIKIQKSIVLVFVLEIVIRWIGKESISSYLKNGWNIFDIIIVSSSFIPDTLFDNSAAISVFRVIRVFRILRLLRTIPELQVIITVLLKSIRSLTYTGMLFGIFMYMYSVMGVILFRLPEAATSPSQPDPYGSISEGFFTLFRILTGEDWTDLRYNLLGVAHVPDWIVTGYHVSWMAVSAFLLVNLVVGTVVSNFEQVMQASKDVEIASKEHQLHIEISALHSKLDGLEQQMRILLEKDQKPG
ncbi:MAG: ion transporter [SAR324 cluster bacterium]|nr:ion transporter [SAR324 cluster bacterium]